MSNLKQNLRKLRKQKGLSQEELVDQLAEFSVKKHGRDVGFTRGSVSAWEHGVEPPLIKLQLIAEFFNTTVDELTAGNADQTETDESKKVDCQEILEIFKEELRFKNKMIERLMNRGSQD